MKKKIKKYILATASMESCYAIGLAQGVFGFPTWVSVVVGILIAVIGFKLIGDEND